MAEILTLAQIQDRFEDEWVLINEPETDEHLQVVRGKVVWHSKDRDEVYQKAIEMRLLNSATIYTGRIPENTAVIL